MSRLIRLVDAPDVEVSQGAIWSLGQIGGERAVSALNKLAESDDTAVSTAAGQALEEAEFADMSDEQLRLLDIDLDKVEMVDEDGEPVEAWELTPEDEKTDEADWPDEFLDLD